MSLIRSAGKRLRALAELEVPFDEAERLLLAARRDSPALSPAERMRRARAERVEDLNVRETHALARETRLRRWLGWDIAPPPGPEESQVNDQEE